LEQVAQGYRIRQYTHAHQEGEIASQKSQEQRERQRERDTCVGRSGAFLLRDCNMISAMAANGALRCPDIICCSSSLQSSADPSLLFSLDRNKEKKTHELYIYVGKNQPLQKATRSHQKSPHSCNPIYSVIQEASRIVFAARQSAAEAV
jgi:hypothetical protein